MIGEIGLDMGVFGTARRLCSWAKVSPRTVQSGRRTGKGATGKGTPYLKAALGQMATGAAKTDTFLDLAGAGPTGDTASVTAGRAPTEALGRTGDTLWYRSSDMKR